MNMKLETAKKLAWPWETKFVYEASNLILKSFSSPKYQPVVPCPLIEEIWQRVPGVTLIKDADVSVVIYQNKYFEADNPSEALAQLCIWLRDNNLMEWPK